MRAKFVYPLIMVCAVGSLTARLRAQQPGCYGSQFFTIACCPGRTITYAVPSSSGSNAGDQFYVFCCGPGRVAVDIYGECLEAKLKVPGVLDRLRQLDTDGTLIVASCTGEFVPLPPPAATWDPDRVPEKFSLDGIANSSNSVSGAR